MHNITFDFLGQHRHGSAFHEYLRLRKSFFVDELHWDIPHNDDVEMDQYDNPCAHYSLVLRNGRVVGGARSRVAGQRVRRADDADDAEVHQFANAVVDVEPHAAERLHNGVAVE